MTIMPTERWRRASVALVSLAALQGCALLGGRSPDDRQVTVELRMSRADAIRRVQTVLRDQGYRIRSTLTSGTEPETEPFRQGDDAEVVFRAAITGDARASRVVLTGTWRPRELGGLVLGHSRELRRSDDSPQREIWIRMQNLGVALRRSTR